MGFFLSKLAANLLLPPGMFILLCLAGGIITIFILKSREVRSAGGKRFIYVLLIITLSNALLLYLGSLVPVAALLNAPLERAYRSSTLEADISGDCIVVVDSPKGRASQADHSWWAGCQRLPFHRGGT